MHVSEWRMKLVTLAIFLISFYLNVIKQQLAMTHKMKQLLLCAHRERLFFAGLRIICRKQDSYRIIYYCIVKSCIVIQKTNFRQKRTIGNHERNAHRKFDKNRIMLTCSKLGDKYGAHWRLSQEWGSTTNFGQKCTIENHEKKRTENFIRLGQR